MNAITKTTPMLEYDRNTSSYQEQPKGIRICAAPLRSLFRLPAVPHNIWITVSNRSNRHAHPIWFLRWLGGWVPAVPHNIWIPVSNRSNRHAHPIWFLRWLGGWVVDYAIQSHGRRPPAMSFQPLLHKAADWLNCHFWEILTDRKPHKLYVSVEYLEDE